MNPQDALNVLDRVCSSTKLSREEHVALQQAVMVLKMAITPKPENPKEENKKPEKAKEDSKEEDKACDCKNGCVNCDPTKIPKKEEPKTPEKK